MEQKEQDKQALKEQTGIKVGGYTQEAYIRNFVNRRIAQGLQRVQETFKKPKAEGGDQGGSNLG